MVKVEDIRWVSPNEQVEHDPSFLPKGELKGATGTNPDGILLGGAIFVVPVDKAKNTNTPDKVKFKAS